MIVTALRLLSVGLLALSLLNCITLQFLLAWHLSILSSQKGLFLALGSAACGLSLAILKKQKLTLRLAFTVAAAASALLFLRPLLQVLQLERSWQMHLQQTLGGPPIHSAWWSLKKELLGLQEPPVSFTREIYRPGLGKEQLHIDRYTPSNTTQHSPWILVIHGGGWAAGNSEQLPELNWHLAHQGYAVLAVSYRLAPQSRWPDAKADVLKALKYIKGHAAEWHLDPDRWVILGRSAGGQIAGVVAYSLKGPEKPRGLISYYAPTDLIFGYEISAENDILRSRSLLRDFLGSAPEGDTALYKSAAVMEAATVDSCPTLLLHGVQDSLVSIHHTERLMERLKDLNVRAAAVELPWGPHGFDYFINGPEGQIATSAVDYFLAQVLPLR